MDWDWRQKELAHFGNQIEWLSPSDAAAAYDQAHRLCSNVHYGLDLRTVEGIERFDVNDQPEAGTVWLTGKLDAGNVRVVFDCAQVCQMSAAFFLANWQDMFGPARDDVLIVPEFGNWVLLYWHQDKFEFGLRKASG